MKNLNLLVVLLIVISCKSPKNEIDFATIKEQIIDDDILKTNTVKDVTPKAPIAKSSNQPKK